jgi:hypothetical protein
MNSENHDRMAVATIKHPGSQDTNGVEEDHTTMEVNK